jgi:hypothetical protein
MGELTVALASSNTPEGSMVRAMETPQGRFFIALRVDN